MKYKCLIILVICINFLIVYINCYEYNSNDFEDTNIENNLNNYEPIHLRNDSRFRKIINNFTPIIQKVKKDERFKDSFIYNNSNDSFVSFLGNILN